MNKKVFLFMSASLLALSSCSSSSSIPTGGEKEVLVGDDYSLRFIQKDGKYYPELFFNDNESNIIVHSDEPIVVSVRSKSSGIIETYQEKTYKGQYSSISKNGEELIASGVVVSDAGSEFGFVDSYRVNLGAISVKRTLDIKKVNSLDEGFSSSIGFKDYSSKMADDYDYFMPSIIYKDARNMKSGSIFSNTDLVGKIYVKETRTGLPMMFLRNRVTNYSFSLAHTSIDIDVNGVVGGGTIGEVNDDLKYGSIGITASPYKSIDYTYPCAEGPVTYDAGGSWAKRYHSVTLNNKDEYETTLYLSKGEDYNHAMTSHYLKMYNIINPTIENVDINQIYDDNMKIFKDEFKSFGVTDGVQYGGEPWSLKLPNADATQGYSSQMGFVGQQIPVAYNLYRYGLMNNDVTTKNKGLLALDFWSSATINSTYFPTVWWDPSDTLSGGSRREYPSFLRCMIDGFEGMLDAYLVSAQYGEAKAQYLNAVIKFANNLVAKQNENGSFYRAYNTNGSVNTDTSDVRFQGNSELNTPIAIRFLCKMFEFTGDDKFKEAALKAGEFCYRELYTELGKYVGGTPDNPNVVDKEAAVYALYAFTSLYILSKDIKYLDAAKHAAVSAMSWVYVYDFKVPGRESVKDINTFIDGNVKGFSIIATGHSSADNYAAYIYYELFNLYVLSKDETFKNLSHFIQNNTKLSNDYDGRMGFKYKALMPEATRVADFDFASVGTWLPWSSIANIEPIVNMQKTYSNADVGAIASSLDELEQALNEYGVGGYIL